MKINYLKIILSRCLVGTYSNPYSTRKNDDTFYSLPIYDEKLIGF